MCVETRRKISVQRRNCRDAAQGVVEIIAVEFAGRQIVCQWRSQVKIISWEIV